jgi:hypothetical protein
MDTTYQGRDEMATTAAMQFNATIEYLPGNAEAIVSLTDGLGGWQGAGRVACRSAQCADLYEAGYTLASITATSKGGRLETFREGRS